MINEFLFDSREQLLAALEAALLEQVGKALTSDGGASLLLSGGSTPGPVYESLGKNLDSKVQIALVDDRWVDLDHKGSNEALLKRCFPNHQVTGMKTANEKPLQAEAEVNDRYRELTCPFAVTLLGMGPDGHTASLFPYAQGLDAAMSSDAPLCCAITAKESEVTGPLVDRMTLSLAGILSSKKIILLITGDDKFAVYQKAKSSLDNKLTPITAVLQQRDVSVDVYWAK